MAVLRIVFVVFLMFALNACKKKEYPESQVLNQPEFYVNLVGSGEPMLLQAGTNNYRVYSSYTQDPNGLYTYVSEFKPKGCAGNCSNSLRFEINDSKTYASGMAPDINAALYAGPYNYSSPAWEIQFEATYNKTAASYQWRFGDGSESTEKNPLHKYKQGGRYNVCLTITSVTGCESTICNVVSVGYPAGSCMATIESASVNGNSVQFYSQAVGEAPLTYYWEFGDGNSSTLAQPTHVYAFRGAYPVRLTVHDAQNRVAVWNYIVVTGSDNSSCASNLKTSAAQQLSNEELFSRVKIQYTDASGITYSSDAYAPDPDQAFEILSVEDYEVNELGEATKKLKVRFTASLYNGSKRVKFKDSDAVICVSYKK